MSARLRLMPMVMTAAGLLLALKLVELTSQSSYLFVPPAAAAGAAQGSEKAEKNADAGQGETPEPADGAPALPDDHGSNERADVSTDRPKENPPVDARGELSADPSSDKALLGALKKRREAIEARASELDARDALLKAAEKRLSDRLAELKRLEATIADADKRRAEEESGKIKELVTLYEGMKPKEAARIFDKLEPQVLLDVASRMKPRTLAVVMGLMAPEAAQKLTVALARREASPSAVETLAASELPKIEGRPTR